MSILSEQVSERVLAPERWYDFLMALNRAIALFTDQSVDADAGAFLYRGADLRHAVERQLYYRFSSDRCLRSLFGQAIASAADPSTALSAEMRATLTAGVAQGTGMGIIRHLRSLAKSGHGLITDRGRRARSPDAASLILNAGDTRPQLLFMVIHERFERFLAPVARALTLPCAYLTALDPALTTALAERGVPVAHAGPVARGGALPAGLGGVEYLATYFDAFLAALTALRPRCVVVPEGGAPPYEVLNRACRLLGIPVICIQQGWSPYIHPGFCNLSYDQMLVWSDYFGELLRPWNPEQAFLATGNCMVEFPEHERAPGAAISFFISGSPSQSQFDTLTTAEMYWQFLDLARWTAESFPGVPVFLREHPQIPLSESEKAPLLRLPNVRFAPSREAPLRDVLRASRLSIAIYSTTILESIAGGVVPLIVNATSLPRFWPDVAAEGAALEVASFQAARHAIGRVASEPDFLKPFQQRLPEVRRRLFAHDGPDAVRRTADAIGDLCG